MLEQRSNTSAERTMERKGKVSRVIDGIHALSARWPAAGNTLQALPQVAAGSYSIKDMAPVPVVVANAAATFVGAVTLAGVSLYGQFLHGGWPFGHEAASIPPLAEANVLPPSPQ